MSAFAQLAHVLLILDGEKAVSRSCFHVTGCGSSIGFFTRAALIKDKIILVHGQSPRDSSVSLNRLCRGSLQMFCASKS